MPGRNGDRSKQDRLAAFDTGSLLRAVDVVDRMREHLDGDGYKPPEIRNDLLRLHQLAMKVVHQGYGEEATAEMFELATDIEDRIRDLEDALDRLRETVTALVELEPDEHD